MKRISPASGIEKVESCSPTRKLSGALHDDVLRTSSSLADFVEASGAKESMTALNTIQQELVCSVCLDLFDNPVCLKCGHSICYKCAYRIAAFARACRIITPDRTDLKAQAREEPDDPARNPALKAAAELLLKGTEKAEELIKERETVAALDSMKEKDTERPPELTCPLCRRVTLLGDVRPNAALRDMVSSVKMRDPTASFTPEMIAERAQLEKEQNLLKEQLKVRPFCTVCGEAAAVYCADCGPMCMKHSSEMHSNGPQRFHQLSSPITPEFFGRVQRLVRQSSLSFGDRDKSFMLLCGKHGKRLDLFCENCNIAVCDNCLLTGEHSGHKCCSMISISEKLSSLIAQQKKEVVEGLPHCKTVADTYEKWSAISPELHKNALNDVRREFAKLYRIAEEQESLCSQRASEVCDNSLKSSRDRSGAYELLIKHAKEVLQNISQASRVSQFAREMMFLSLSDEYCVLKKALACVPRENVKQKPVIRLQDARNLLVGHPLVNVKRIYSFYRQPTMFDRILGNLRCRNGHVLMGFSVRCRPGSFVCDVCRGHDRVDSHPSFYCPLCDYDLCIECATKLASNMMPPSSFDDVLSSGFKNNIVGDPCSIGTAPMLYCGKRYTSHGSCFCGSCDGRCGPNNGCPCPDCFVTFEMIILSAERRCSKGHILTPMTYGPLRARSRRVECSSCHKTVDVSHNNYFGLVCEECGYNNVFVCAKCAFEAATSR